METPDIDTRRQAPVETITSPRWGLITICLCVTVTEGFNVIVFGSIVPIIIADPTMGTSSSVAGAVGSMTYIGMLMGGTLAGLAGDKYGRKRILLVAMSFFAIGAVFSGLAVGPFTLGAARFVSGLGVGGAITTGLALASSNAPSRHAGTVITVTMAGIPLGGTLASLISIPVIPAAGWRPMFFIGGALTAVIFLVVALTQFDRDPPTYRTTTHAEKVNLVSLFRERGTVLMLIISAVGMASMFVWYGINTWLVAAMVGLQVPLTGAFLFGFTLSGGGIIGSFLTMRWADIWGTAKVGAVMATLIVVGLVSLSIGPRHLAIALIAVALIGAGGMSAINLLQATVSTLFPERLRATSLGWSNGISYVGAIAGPAVGGIVLSSSAGPIGVFVLYSVAGAVVVGTMLLLVVWPRKPEI